MIRRGKKTNGGVESPLVSPREQGSPRRVFLQQLAQLLGGSYLLTLPACWWSKARAPKAHAPKATEPKPVLPTAVNLSPREVELCAAACDAILPPDHEPGAVQLGVIEYLDRRFDRVHEGPDKRERFTTGLRELNEWTIQREGREFPELPQKERESTLNAYATDGGPRARGFVTQLVIHTLEGTLADPTYGGNRDRAGWTLIGFQVPCPNPSCP